MMGREQLLSNVQTKEEERWEEEGVERNCPHIKGKKGELRMGRCRNGGINMEKVKPKAPPYLIFVIFLHGQNFWRIEFTPKNA